MPELFLQLLNHDTQLLPAAYHSNFYFKKDIKVSSFTLNNALSLGHSQNNEHPGRSYHTT
jgi:hypothetical protein